MQPERMMGEPQMNDGSADGCVTEVNCTGKAMRVE